MAPNHWLLQTESTASFCLRLSASVKVRHVSARDRRPIPLAVTEVRVRLFVGLTSEYLVSEERQVYRRNI